MIMTKENSLSLKQVWMIALEGISQDLTAALSSAFFFCFGLAAFQFVFTYGPLLLLPQPLDENMILFQRACEAIWGILLSILYSMIIPFAVYRTKGHYKNMSLMGFIQKHMKLVSIETLRTLPVIVLHLVLFVIPGLVKMIRLIFVPFVVQIHRPYQNGKVDALKESAHLTNGSFAGIASFYFISQIIIVVIVMAIPSAIQKSIGYDGASAQNLIIDFVFNVPIGVVIELAAAVGLLRIFEKLVILKEGPNELAF